MHPVCATHLSGKLRPDSHRRRPGCRAGCRQRLRSAGRADVGEARSDCFPVTLDNSKVRLRATQECAPSLGGRMMVRDDNDG